MIPLLTRVAFHPEFAIDFAVLCLAEVDLVAIVALLVLIEALVAELAEADAFIGRRNDDLGELGGLCFRAGRVLLLADAG